jgi:WD40 repeat protein
MTEILDGILADSRLLFLVEDNLAGWTPLVRQILRTARFEGHGDWATIVAFSLDGKRLAAAFHDGTARLWDLATGAEIAQFAGHELVVTGVAFSPDATRLATASNDGTARLWDLSGIPKGSAFAIVCEWLPIRDGVPDTDLAEALTGTSIEITEPICGPCYDPPMPWWATPGSTEPTPAGVAE